ncbi:MAG: Nif3-like dinuclear metal center hexameric protein [Candidatus Woesebacteria bacterium]|jgi:dinuclear metal center YbgI/SA1388 family protein
MIKQSQLDDYLKKLFTPDLIKKAREIDTKLPNGLQVPGRKEIKKIVTGVSISAELIKQAIKKKADTIIVHHALNLALPYNILLPYQQKRLKLLLENNLNLFGFHYCLDADSKIGNNAVMAKLLKAKIVDSYFDTWGFVGELSKAASIQSLADKVKKICDHDVFVINASKGKVKRLGIVSGGGIPDLKDLAEIREKQVELHITGEIKESSLHQFLESGISYFAGGHYATETLGIKALTKKIKKDFKGQVEIEFVDINNPL